MMAYEFRSALDTVGDADGWAIASCGTTASERAAICSVCLDVLRDAHGHTAEADAHISRSLAMESLAERDLVIVASRVERAQVIQADLSVRTRTFTLREAIHLGAVRIETDGERAVLDRLEEQGSADLRDYAAVLNWRRGLVALGRPGRLSFRWLPSRDPDPLDVPDDHHARMRAHRSMLRGLQTDVRLFHTQLSRFLGAHNEVKRS